MRGRARSNALGSSAPLRPSARETVRLAPDRIHVNPRRHRWRLPPQAIARRPQAVAEALLPAERQRPPLLQGAAIGQHRARAQCAARKVRQVDEKAFDILDAGGRVWNLRRSTPLRGPLAERRGGLVAAARAAAPTAPLLSTPRRGAATARAGDGDGPTPATAPTPRRRRRPRRRHRRRRRPTAWRALGSRARSARASKRRWYELRGGVLRHYDGPAEGGGKARKPKSALTVRGLVVEEAMAAAGRRLPPPPPRRRPAANGRRCARAHRRRRRRGRWVLRLQIAAGGLVAEGTAQAGQRLRTTTTGGAARRAASRCCRRARERRGQRAPGVVDRWAVLRPAALEQYEHRRGRGARVFPLPELTEVRPASELHPAAFRLAAAGGSMISRRAPSGRAGPLARRHARSSAPCLGPRRRRRRRLEPAPPRVQVSRFSLRRTSAPRAAAPPVAAAAQRMCSRPHLRRRGARRAAACLPAAAAARWPRLNLSSPRRPPRSGRRRRRVARLLLRS